jgi:homoserine O-acetyltransferase/O-succinyltransferase
MQHDYDVFVLGALPLQSGATLRAAKLAYKTYGPLDRDGGNVTLLLASFSRAFDKAAAKLLRS